MERTRLLQETFRHFVSNEWLFDAAAALRLGDLLHHPEDRARVQVGPEGCVWGGMGRGVWEGGEGGRAPGKKRRTNQRSLSFSLREEDEPIKEKTNQ